MKYFDSINTDVNVSYNQLKRVADDIIKNITKDIDSTIEIIHSKSEKLTDLELSMYMLKLACLSYDLGEHMEHANLRSECAVAILKENTAVEFAKADGSNQVRQNEATLNTKEELAVSLLYETVAGLLKTKLNESHRVVDVLKSIQISRNAKAKQDNLTSVKFEGEVFD